MSTEVNQKMNASDAPREETISTGPNGTFCDDDAGVGVSPMICEEPTAASEEPDMGVSRVGEIGNAGSLGVETGGRASLDGDAYGGGMGCCSSEGESDMAVAAICRPVSEGVAASIEVLECQRGLSTQDADGGAEVGLDDQCTMTDDEDEQRLVAMDSASIIPEAAMKCGILPIDSAEGKVWRNS